MALLVGVAVAAKPSPSQARDVEKLLVVPMHVLLESQHCFVSSDLPELVLVCPFALVEPIVAPSDVRVPW